jgi:hypothetical protein
MMQRSFKRVAAAVGLAILLSAVAVSLVGAYAEEPIPWRDPVTHRVDNSVEVSTIHTDITYVLALAAGFSQADSRTLTIWDQLVDTNLISTKDGTFTNCTGTFPPKITHELCKTPQAGDTLYWPNWSNPSWDALPPQKRGKSCVTSRYGPFEGFFHFPHRDGGPEVAALKAWAWGDKKDLIGYEGYVWGPPMSAAVPNGMTPETGFFGYTCFYTKSVKIDTGIRPGSLQAFGTYLHSLADSYSHQECQQKTDALGWAWPTHTSPYRKPDIYECNYAPNGYLQNISDSHHGREFGTNWPDDSGRTDKAIRAVYGELVERSRQREGVYKPLDLNTRLKGKFHNLTLDQALYNFVHEWNFDQPEARRDYADQLATAILAQRVRR